MIKGDKRGQKRTKGDKMGTNWDKKHQQVKKHYKVPRGGN